MKYKEEDENMAYSISKTIEEYLTEIDNRNNRIDYLQEVIQEAKEEIEELLYVNDNDWLVVSNLRSLIVRE